MSSELHPDVIYNILWEPGVRPRLRPERRLSFGTAAAIGTVVIKSCEPLPGVDHRDVYAHQTARFDVLVPMGLSARLVVARTVTDAARLDPLAAWGADDLDELSLLECSLGDDAVDRLAGLRGLRYLDLYGTGITARSYRVLGGLRGLEWLSLSYTRVGTAGIEALAGLADLKRLSLRGTDITDNALVPVAELEHLWWLSVADTAVTSYGLEHLLARAPNLRMVAIHGTPADREARTQRLPRRPGLRFVQH